MKYFQSTLLLGSALCVHSQMAFYLGSCTQLKSMYGYTSDDNGYYDVQVSPEYPVANVYCDFSPSIANGGASDNNLAYTFFLQTTGVSHSRGIDPNTCQDYGMDVWVPRNKYHFQQAYAFSVLHNGGDSYVADDLAPFGIYRPANGCGTCTGTAMNSGAVNAACEGTVMLTEGNPNACWQATDEGDWWLRDSTYSEPNGDYNAGCWLGITGISSDMNGLGFNDLSCNYPSGGRYLCSPLKDSQKVCTCTGGSPAIGDSCPDWNEAKCADGGCFTGFGPNDDSTECVPNTCDNTKVTNPITGADYSSCSGISNDTCIPGCQTELDYVAVVAATNLTLVCNEDGSFDGSGSELVCNTAHPTMTPTVVTSAPSMTPTVTTTSPSASPTAVTNSPTTGAPTADTTAPTSSPTVSPTKGPIMVTESSSSSGSSSNFLLIEYKMYVYGDDFNDVETPTFENSEFGHLFPGVEPQSNTLEMVESVGTYVLDSEGNVVDDQSTLSSESGSEDGTDGASSSCDGCTSYPVHSATVVLQYKLGDFENVKTSEGYSYYNQTEEQAYADFLATSATASTQMDTELLEVLDDDDADVLAVPVGASAFLGGYSASIEVGADVEDFSTATTHTRAHTCVALVMFATILAIGFN